MASEIMNFLLSSPLLERIVASFPFPFAILANGKIRLASDVFKDSPDRSEFDTAFRRSKDALDKAPEGEEIASASGIFTDKYAGWKWPVAFSEESFELRLFIPLHKDFISPCQRKNLEARDKMIASLWRDLFGNCEDGFKTIMSFLEKGYLCVNTVIQCEDELMVDSLIDLSRAIRGNNAVMDMGKDVSATDEFPGDLAGKIASGDSLLIARPEMSSLFIQDKLARALLRRKLESLSSSEIAAPKTLTPTGANLAALVEKGEFSADLLEVLQTVKITLAPARSSPENDSRAIGASISAVAEKTREGTEEAGKYPTGEKNDSSSDAERREAAVAPQPLLPCESASREEIAGEKERNEDVSELDIEKSVDEAERKCIMKALRLSNGRKDKAAELLKMNLRTFHRRCARLGI